MNPTVASLFEYPVKSARGLSVQYAQVCSEGLSRDRRFLFSTADGTFISGRSHPRLVLLDPTWDGRELTLSSQGHEILRLRPTLSCSSSVAVWKDRFDAWDQGDEAACTVSNWLGDEVRLVWLGESRRSLRWDRNRRLTFADAAPLMALGQASVADLERRVGEPLGVRRFRPNLVLEGMEPYEEDRWKRVKIGSVEFRWLDGCSRCEFTTIDPETAERHPRGEPVKTFEGYRKVDTGFYFGMNIMPLNTGILHVGDTVTVLETRKPLSFSGWNPVPADQPALPFTLRCTAVCDEGPGTKSWSWERVDGRPLSWHAGQYLTLKLPLKAGPLWRTYSLSSRPGTAPRITVKCLNDGRGSRWLHENVKVGTVIESEGVGGGFSLVHHPWSSYLFLAAGSGITPLFAMLSHAAATNGEAPIALHWSIRDQHDRWFTGEWSTIQKALGCRLEMRVRETQREGRLDEADLLSFCPDLRDRRVLVCGPPEYRAHVRSLLIRAACKIDRRYHEERFGESPLPVPAKPVPGIVTFEVWNQEVRSDGETTILQLAERAGLPLPSQCRSGDCGTCRVRSRSGEWLLACQTIPEGDLWLNK